MNASREQDDKKRKAIRRAFAKILPICLFALFVSGLVLSVANDMYAFVKDEREVRIYIENPCSVEEFSKILGQNKILKNPAVFSMYVKLKNKTDTVEEFVGGVTLNSQMSYRVILASIS